MWSALRHDRRGRLTSIKGRELVVTGGMYTQRLKVDELAAGAQRFDAVAYAQCKRAQVEVMKRMQARAPRLVISAMHQGGPTPEVCGGLAAFSSTDAVVPSRRRSRRRHRRLARGG